MKRIVLNPGILLLTSLMTIFPTKSQNNSKKPMASEQTVNSGIPKAPVREIKTNLGIIMQPVEKMKWMLDGKLGMFIHWGLYSGPGKGEWYMENKGISPEEYRKLAYPESGDLYFDARDFDARKWTMLAKKVGMRYMNMVTQHHDGYALFESKYMNSFTSKQTHNRDFVGEYVKACREQGLRVGLYKTLINWRFPGYYDVTGKDCKKNKFGYTTNISNKESARLMKEELYCQTKELVTNYGVIDQLFWDGGWLAQEGPDAAAAYFWEPGKFISKENEWPVNPYFQDIDNESSLPLGLMGIVRKYQPDILVNSRSGWVGDYGSEEGSSAIKGKIRSNVVEKCITLAPTWGYSEQMENPDKIMPLKNLKRHFADCIVRNMCLLINVGPDRHGNIPKAVEQRLTQFGDWVNETQEAIFGTRGGPWEPVDGQYGFSFKDNIIYLYLLGDYSNNLFELPTVDKGMKVQRAYDINTKERICVRQTKQNISLNGLKLVKGDITVIALVFNRNIR